MANLEIAYPAMLTAVLDLDEIYNPAQMTKAIKDAQYKLFEERAGQYLESWRGKAPGAVPKEHHTKEAIERSKAGFRQFLRRMKPIEWRGLHDGFAKNTRRGLFGWRILVLIEAKFWSEETKSRRDAALECWRKAYQDDPEKNPSTVPAQYPGEGPLQLSLPVRIERPRRWWLAVGACLICLFAGLYLGSLRETPSHTNPLVDYIDGIESTRILEYDEPWPLPYAWDGAFEEVGAGGHFVILNDAVTPFLY